MDPKHDRLPPHSPEAEQGILGCLLLDAREAEKIKPDLFYDLRHQTIARAILSLVGDKKPVDMLTVQQVLKNRNELDQVGGFAYLNDLPEKVPSAANLGYYLEILHEKAEVRRQISVCTEVIGRCYDFEGDPDELIWANRSDLARLAGESKSAGHTWTINRLASYPTGRDPNAVVGLRNGFTTRFLCRGYSAWLIGPSGVGKSSLVTQIAVHWALGLPIFGITPLAPQRILMLQAENDEGDAAEMVQGVLKSMGIDEMADPERWEMVRENIIVLTERTMVGTRFCNWMGKKIVEHRADMVFADPFLSFGGIDVGRQDQCSKFLRQDLNPILDETGAILLAAHHTGKPKQSKDMKSWTALDYAYQGIGSSELVNWARAVMCLVQLGDSKHYELKLAKRGGRAAAVHPNGEPAWQSVFLRHSQDRIYWEQVDPPEQEEEAERPPEKKKTKVQTVAESNLYEVISRIPSEGETANSLGDRLSKFSKKLGCSLGSTKCRTDLLDALVKGRKLKVDDTTGLYTKGENA